MKSHEEETHGGTWPKSNAKWIKRLFAICLVLVLISCIGASVLQTSYGTVQVTKFKIPTANGQWISGQLFKPNNATEQNKVPMVIAAHGYLNNSQMQDSTAIELSRRGIAVITFDLFFHGGSSSSRETGVIPGLTEGKKGVMSEIFSKNAWGVIPMVEYAYNNLNYVDKTKIGVMGHSGGSMAAQMAIVNYGGQYLAALGAAQAPESDGGTTVTKAEQDAANTVDKIAAGFVTSFVMADEQMLKAVHANYGINFSRFDEGGYENKRGNADLSGNAPESLTIINASMPEGKKVDLAEIGKYYGDAANKTLRVIYNPKETHILMPVSSTSTGYAVDFFTKSFQVSNPIPTSNQVWNWKEFFNFIGLVACYLIIVPMAVLLLRLPVFASVTSPVPGELPALTDRKAKIFFWSTWALSWIISWLSFLPVGNLDRYLFPAGPKMEISGTLFTQPATNFILIWAVFNGLVGLLLFWISYRFIGKQNGFTAETSWVKINGKTLLKTFALAVCIFVGFFALLAFAQFFFNTDYRIWLLAITPFNSHTFLTALPYMPFFFIFFFASSALLNGSMRVEGQKNWVSMLIGAIGSVLGLVIIIVIQYTTLFSTGAIFYKALPMDWLHIVTAIPLVVLLFASNYISRYLFKATGKVWLGAMVNTMILVMVFAANTATLSPF